MDIQKQVRDNVEEFRSIINDMSNWEKEMKRKENSLRQQKESDLNDDLPPVRAKLRKEEKNGKTDNIHCEYSESSEYSSSRDKSLLEKDLGNEFVKQKKWSDAIHHYSAAIDYYSEDPVFFCNRAHCYLQTKQWVDAVNDCNRALAFNPNYVKALYRKGLALKELNEVKKARHYFLKALELEPANHNVKNDLQLLNEILIDSSASSDMNDFDNNLTETQRREKSLDEKERGNSFVKQEKWIDAIHHYTEAIKCFSKDATFYCNRALCFLHIKKYKEAETDCSTALQLDPQYVKAYHRRGLALKELNQLKEAYENFKKAFDLDSENSHIKNDLRNLEKSLGDSTSFKLGLEDEFDDSKQSDQEKAYSKKEKGNTFVKKKNWKSAIECYTEACKLYPDDVSFNLNRALCFLKMNEPKKALLDCTFVLEREPSNVKAYYRRALAHEAVDNFSKAHDDLLMAFKLDPSDETIQSRLTKLEKKMGLLESESAGNEEDITISADESSVNPVSTKRLTGEKFTKLGGYFVQPLKKLPHQASTKPLKIIQISDINENPLKSAFDEIRLTEMDVLCNEDSENQDQKPTSVGSDNLKNSFEENTKSIDVSMLPVPKTYVQFVSTWDSLNSPESLRLYLMKIRGEDLPRIFKESLESFIFSDILEILATEFVKANESVYDYLLGLSHVKRIKALLLFASEKDNAFIKVLLNHIQTLNEAPESELNALKSFFYC